MLLCQVIILTVFFENCLSSSPTSSHATPNVTIQALKPQGLRVSIPDSQDLKQFAFHANINEPIHMKEIGQIHGEVVHRAGQKCEIANPDVKLKVGDKIHYWALVNTESDGETRTSDVYEVTELQNRGEEEKTTRSPSSTFRNSITICEQVMVNLTQTLLDLVQQMDSLRETNEILMEIVEKNQSLSKTLTLDGAPVLDNELTLTVQAVVKDKLELPFKVKNVVRNKDGVVEFEVGDLSEKVEVVKAARRKLKQSMFTISY